MQALAGGTISALKTQTAFAAINPLNSLNSLNDSIEYFLVIHTQKSLIDKLRYSHTKLNSLIDIDILEYS